MLLAQLARPDPAPPTHWTMSHEVAPVQSSKQLEPPLHLISQFAAPLQSTSQVAPNLHSAAQAVVPTQSKPQLHATLSQTGVQLSPAPQVSAQAPDTHPLHVGAGSASGALGLASGASGLASGGLGLASAGLELASGVVPGKTQKPCSQTRGVVQSLGCEHSSAPDRGSKTLHPDARRRVDTMIIRRGTTWRQATGLR